MNNKPKALDTIFNEKRESEQRKVVETSESVVKPETRDLPPSRQGKRPIQIWVLPEAHKQARILAAHLEKSMEQVGVDGLNAVFVENGLPPIA